MLNRFCSSAFAISQRTRHATRGRGISQLKITALHHRVDGSSQISWRRASLLASRRGRQFPAAAVPGPGTRRSVSDSQQPLFVPIAHLATRRVGERRKHDCKPHGVQLQSPLRLSVAQWVRDIVLQRRKLLVASLVILVAIAAVWFIRESVLYERTDDARIDGKIMPLSARINGYVQQVNVIEGQMVHAGDVLAVLDQKEYGIAVYQATANLAYAVNTVASLYYSAAITVTTAYDGVTSAQAAVKSAQTEVAAAENKLRADLRSCCYSPVRAPSPNSFQRGTTSS